MVSSNPLFPTKNYSVLLYYNKKYKPIKSLGTVRLSNHNAFGTVFHERNDIQYSLMGYREK